MSVAQVGTSHTTAAHTTVQDIHTPHDNIRIETKVLTTSELCFDTIYADWVYISVHDGTEFLIATV